MADRCRILVVEDDENFNRSIVNSLRKDGYFVHGVASGAEAIRSLWSEAYDVVISDLKTPGPDGFELLQWIRAYCPNTRMIMVAPVGSSVTRTQALEGGVVSYLEKPLDLHLLKEELRRLLQQTGFSASLDSFDLLDVIQIITMSRRNIALLVNTGLEEQGTLRYQGGELIWAEYGILRGEEAFFDLAAHKNGTVIHQPWNEQIMPNVRQPLSRLIFQALQYRSKYAAFQQQTGEQEVIPAIPRVPEAAAELRNDSPFGPRGALYVPHTPIPATPQVSQSQSLPAPRRPARMIVVLMGVSGVGKSALEWRHPRRTCPACGRQIRERTCRCSGSWEGLAKPWLCRRGAPLAPMRRPQSRPYDTAYGRSLRPCLGTSGAPRRRARSTNPS